MPVPNYWTRTKPIFKKVVFLVNFLQNWDCDNFSYRNARVTKLWSHDHIYSTTWLTWWNFLGDLINRNYNVINFILKYVFFKWAWSSYFCWPHQNCNYFSFNQSLKTEKEFKIFGNYVSEAIYICFLDIAIFAHFRWRNADAQQNSRGLSRASYNFWIFFS